MKDTLTPVGWVYNRTVSAGAQRIRLVSVRVNKNTQNVGGIDKTDEVRRNWLYCVRLRVV